jgi:hypothetical protein
MPSHLAHCKISIELFGKSYYKVHKAIDSAVFVVGYGHRKYFHDDFSLLAIANQYYPGDDLAFAAAKFHVELDWMCTQNPNLKIQIEKWAKKQVSKRRKSKSKQTKSTQPIDAELARLLKDIKQLNKLIELADRLRSR